MQQPPMTIKAKAKFRMMDLLAQRDHSEKELRQKLRNYLRPKKTRYKPLPSEEKIAEIMEQVVEAINEAIEYAKTHNWLAPPEKVSNSFGNSLHRRKKGIHYINQYLAQKGLPPIAVDSELAAQKAQELLNRKYPDVQTQPREIKAKAMRFLASRGFSMEVIRQLIK